MMKSRRLLWSFLALVFSFGAVWPAAGATKIWTNVSGGSWSTAANWMPNGPPTLADTAFITNNGTYQVSLDANATFASLTLGGASGTQTLSNSASTLILTASSAIRNNGVLILGGGSLSGSNGLTIASGGELRLATSATKTFSALRLLNQGTVRWADGPLQSDFTAPLTVVSNANLWLVSSNHSLFYSFGGAQPQFHNTGTFRKSAGAGTTAINNWLFNNAGTVDVQSGMLTFDSVNGTVGGTWTTAGATEIRFNSGTYTNAASASFGGPGLSRFLGTTLWLTGTEAPPGLRLEAGTVQPLAGFQGGSITSLTLHGAMLATTGVVNTVSGSLVLSNGSLSGALTIAPSGQLILAGTGTKTFSALRLLNQGTVLWADGPLQSDFTAPLTVVSNANLWLVSSNHSLFYSFGGAQPQFHNSGTFRKSAGAGTTTINNWLFNNTGTVDVQSGLLAFDSVNGTLDGAWTIAGIGEVRFNSGTYTNSGGAGFSGAGLSRFLGTTLWLAGAGAPPGLRLEAGTVQLANAFQGGSITNLVLHGGTLNTTNTVTGSLVLSNGNLSGVITIAPSGQLTLAGTGTKTFSALRLLNQGTVFWADGPLQSDFTAPLTVVSNANLWLVSSNHSLFYSFGGAQPQFHNTGTFRKSAGAGTTTINNWLFNNTGTVDVQSGLLAFDSVNGTLGGAWTIAGIGEVRFNSGTYTNSGGAGFSGAGPSRFLGTTLWLVGAGAPPGLRLEAGTVQLANTFQGGSITNLTIHGATLLTTGAVKTVTGSLVASNGAFSGMLTIAPSGQLTLAGTGTKTFSALNLLNQGTVLWADGPLQSDFTAPLTVVSNANLWLVSSNHSLFYSFGGAQPQFHNTGTFRKSAGAGTTTINNWQFNNTGTVDVQSGLLAFDGVNGTLGGAWFAANLAEVRFNSGTYTNGAGASFTGAGLSRFLGTTLWLTGAAAPTGLRLEGGTVMPLPGFQGGNITSLTLHGAMLTTTGAVNRVSGSLVLSNGALSGVLTIAPGAQLLLAGTGTKTFSALRLLNQGTVQWVDGPLQSDFTAPLTVVSNANLWLVTSNHSLFYSFGGAQPQFHNTGIFRKSAGPGTTTINNWLFNNTGTVEVQSGTVDFNTPPILMPAGQIHLANANLVFSQPQLLNGRLHGHGTVSGTVTNAGVIAPTNIGALIITGSYYQDTSPGPRLEFSLGGTAPGTNYSVLRVNGTARTGNPIVDGSLVVGLAGGFVPALGSRFDVLTAGTLVAGPASNVSAGGATFQVQTNATRLSLVTLTTGPAPPALVIVKTPTGVSVSWPATPGFILQTTTNLNTVPASWSNVPGSPNPYNAPATDPKRFFRLFRP